MVKSQRLRLIPLLSFSFYLLSPKKNLTFATIIMATILVTGGCGYIGSHTIVDLIENGYDVISVDNNSRSNPRILDGIEGIIGKKVKNYKVDLCNFDDTFAIFQENDIQGIIHFAAINRCSHSQAVRIISSREYFGSQPSNFVARSRFA